MKEIDLGCSNELKYYSSLLTLITGKELEKMNKNPAGFEWNLNLKNINLISELELYDENGKTFEIISEIKFSEEFRNIFLRIKKIIRPELEKLYPILEKLETKKSKRSKKKYGDELGK